MLRAVVTIPFLVVTVGVATAWQAGGVPAVVVRYWAGARRAAGVDSETLEAGTLADLRAMLTGRPGLARISEVASFLVNGQQANDDAHLPPGAEVDVLPPFAGG